MQHVGINGTRTGSVTATSNSVVIAGNGPSSSRLVASSQSWCVAFGSTKVDVLVIKAITLDANGQSVALNAPSWAGVCAVRLLNVRFENYTDSGFISDGTDADLRNVSFAGSGVAMKKLAAGRFFCRDFTVAGGNGGFIKAHDGIATDGIVLRNGTITLDYWTRSGLDTTGTFTATTATLADVPDEPALYDVIRVGSGNSCTLGRVMGWVGNVATVDRWRTVRNADASTPSDGACSVLSRADMDVGGIHLTSGCRFGLVDNVTVRGGFSDMITVRGDRNTVRNCSVSMGQDMGFTIEGRQIVSNCTATDVQFNAFVAMQPGGASLYDCTASGEYVNGFDDQYASWSRLYNCTAT